MAYSQQTLFKQPSESRLYNFLFGANIKSDAGEAISQTPTIAIAPVTTPPLTAGSATYAGSVAQFRLSGGLAGTLYKVTVSVTTSAGNTLEDEGKLQVLNS